MNRGTRLLDRVGEEQCVENISPKRQDKNADETTKNRGFNTPFRLLPALL